MGDGPFRLKEYFTPHYWVNANSYYPVPENDYKAINSLKDTVFIFSDSVCYASREVDYDFLGNNLVNNWFAYDQKHFEGKKCSPQKCKCCKLVDLFPNRKTIQEYIRDSFNSDKLYHSGSTVAIHAFAFAIILSSSAFISSGVIAANLAIMASLGSI